jgi:hyperosmotically inducible periplasmic protein
MICQPPCKIFEEGTMKSSTLSILALAGLLSAGMASPALLHAQESAAREEMQATESNAKNGNAGKSVKHLYRATRDELGDAAMTTKIKTALLSDKATRTLGIHVKSNQGLITLTGEVDSPHTAARAQSIAANVNGVQSVKNELTWHSSGK